MKEIKAYIRCDRALKALDALGEAGMKHATLTHVLAVGAEAECDQAESRRAGHIVFICFGIPGGGEKTGNQHEYQDRSQRRSPRDSVQISITNHPPAPTSTVSTTVYC